MVRLRLVEPPEDTTDRLDAIERSKTIRSFSTSTPQIMPDVCTHGRKGNWPSGYFLLKLVLLRCTMLVDQLVAAMTNAILRGILGFPARMPTPQEWCWTTRCRCGLGW